MIGPSPGSHEPPDAGGRTPTTAGTGSPIGSTYGPDEGGLIGAVIGAVTNQVKSSVKPAAVAALAQSFTFPLTLAVLVVLFLLVQSRLDGRDPKLRYAPRSAGEAFVEFEEEDR
jgi:hypothetical protein